MRTSHNLDLEKFSNFLVHRVNSVYKKDFSASFGTKKHLDFETFWCTELSNYFEKNFSA